MPYNFRELRVKAIMKSLQLGKRRQVRAGPEALLRRIDRLRLEHQHLEGRRSMAPHQLVHLMIYDFQRQNYSHLWYKQQRGHGIEDLAGEKKKPLKALNDGGMCLRTHGMKNKPIVSLVRNSQSLVIEPAKKPNCMQAKRRYAGGLVHETDQKEQYGDRLLAQGFANLLGHAMSTSKLVAKRGAGGDRSRG